VGLEANQVGFELRSLQEFMAAEGLMEGDEGIVGKRLRQIAPISNWRNVFLFAAGKCFAEQQHLRDTIHTICAELNDASEDAIVRLSKVGSQLALDLLEDGPARRQPKFASMLTRQASGLMDLTPSDYHFRLAQVYEDSLERVYQEEIERRLMRPALEINLGAWATVSYLVDRNVPWAKQLADRYWANEYSTVSTLVSSVRPRHTDEWVRERLVAAIPKCPPEELSNALSSLRRGPVRKPKNVWARLAEYLEISSASPSDRGVPLKAGRRKILSYDVRWLQGSGARRRVGLEEFRAALEDASFGSHPLTAGIRFAINPEREVLAAELRRLPGDFDYRKDFWLRGMVPWPLGAFLGYCDGEASLAALADEVDAGQFGDTADWASAEIRWRTHGVSASDIVHTGKGRMPFARDIADRGFPITAGSLLQIGQNTYGDVQTLTKIWKSVTDPIAQALVGNLALIAFGLKVRNRTGRSDRRSAARGVEQLPDVLDLIRHREIAPNTFYGYYFLREIILALDATVGFSNEVLDVLDDFGNDSEVIGQSFADATGYDASRLVKAYEKKPTRLGVLRILGSLATSGTTVRLVDGSVIGHFDDGPGYRSAAALVRLAQDGWTKDDADDLARAILAAPDRKGFIDASVRYVRDFKASTVSSERFATQLMQGLPRTEWEQARQVQELMDDLLRRRVSNLQLVGVWNELCLPDDVGGLLEA
jgi:hypothetical protein